MRFKVGDRVIVTRSRRNKGRIGDTGILERDDLSKLPYKVRFDYKDSQGNTIWWFHEDEIEIAKNHIIHQILQEL